MSFIKLFCNHKSKTHYKIKKCFIDGFVPYYKNGKIYISLRIIAPLIYLFIISKTTTFKIIKQNVEKFICVDN